jgi:hypothetical protein
VSRAADYNVRIKQRAGDKPRANTVGGAWKNADGSISIVLDVGVSLSWKDDLFIGLFPRACDEAGHGT